MRVVKARACAAVHVAGRVDDLAGDAAAFFEAEGFGTDVAGFDFEGGADAFWFGGWDCEGRGEEE